MNRVSSNDIIIIGAGVSGLILANEIIQRTKRKVLILEKKKKFTYEKNLCFWNIPNNELTKLCNNKWKEIVINIDGEKKKLIDDIYPVDDIIIAMTFGSRAKVSIISNCSLTAAANTETKKGTL